MTFVDSFALVSRRLFYSLFLNRNKFLCLSAGRFHMANKYEKKSKMDLANVPRILSIYRLAVQTFDDKFKSELPSNINKLKSLMDGLKAEDLGFDNLYSKPETWKRAGKPPCTYIEVFQNERMNMSIFILKPGFKMPLHDHPHMHGLLKVISGAVRIRSFSEYPLKDAIKPLDFVVRAKMEALRLARGIHKKRQLFAEISQDNVCSAGSPTCVLSPTVSNYHEIQGLEMPAAFFDILAPPYDTLIEGIGPRRCRYYHVANELSNNLVELQETDVPDCFYCDQAPYLGPILT